MVKNNNLEDISYEKCIKEAKIFLEVFSSISSKLINIKLGEDYLIEKCLEELGENTNSSRAYVFLFRDDFKYMDNVYEWCAKGVSSEKDNLQDLKTKFFPWWFEKLKDNKSIIVSNVENMPEEAETEKETLFKQNVKSLIVLPLIYNDNLIGYLGLDNIFENKIWDKDCEFLLKITAEMFSSIFSKLEYEKQFQSIVKALDDKEKHIEGLNSQILKQNEIIKLMQSKELSKLVGLNEENFNEIIYYVLNILSLDMKIFDEVELELSKDLPSILCNKIEISQVLLNIIKNAIYEIRKKIELHSQTGQTISNNLKIKTYKENMYLVCEVEDSGMGFSEEVKCKLFEPFFTTKGLVAGTGLGLTIAYDIVTNKYNGLITASESQWQGAKFTIKLPFQQKDSY
ncbi:GAF domain-containing sensor histidine kinase [Tissierella praeacuta]|uniref:GAF domain-containing sensor histidine kinase n=1 Tax=Tissierella praeacuta TaxID=43131 RepID=UPI001C10B250|nr:GAF domain-containing sensor histidine kinase [Tissierella praeacuta]MBU5256961.1 GAF domain-containing sensor histidine kinase [Tissierella praeacuta]